MSHHALTAELIKEDEGGVVVYDKFNPLDTNPGGTLRESDLSYTSDTGGNTFVGSRATQPITVPTYIEFVNVQDHVIAGIGSLNDDLDALSAGALWEAGGDGCAAYSADGNAYMNGVMQNGFGAGIPTSGVIGVAYRPVERELYFRNAAGYMPGQNPVTRANPIVLTGMVGLDPYFIGHCLTIASKIRYHSGGLGFSFAVPTGYQAGNFT